MNSPVIFQTPQLTILNTLYAQYIVGWQEEGNNIVWGDGTTVGYTKHVVVNPVRDEDGNFVMGRSDSGLEVQRDGNGGATPLISLFNTQAAQSGGGGGEIGSVSYIAYDIDRVKFQAAGVSVVLNRSTGGGANGILRLSALWNSGSNQERDLSIFGGEGIDCWGSSEAPGAGPGMQVFRINGTLTVKTATDTTFNIIAGNRTATLRVINSDHNYLQTTAGSGFYLKEGSNFNLSVLTGGDVIQRAGAHLQLGVTAVNESVVSDRTLVIQDADGNSFKLLARAI